MDLSRYRGLRSASINSGGNAYSAKTPVNDHDPTRSGTDWNVDESAYKLGGQVSGIFQVLFQMFGFNSLTEMLGQTVAAIWDGVTQLFIAPLGYFAELVGGLIQGFQIPLLDPTKILNLPALFTDVSNLVTDVFTGFTSIFTGWHGTPSSATTVTEAVAEVGDTIAAVRATVSGGYTLQTFTASDAAWTVPDELKNAAELYVGVFGGGGRGAFGQTVKNNTGGVPATGGEGGSSGGYKLEKVDPATLEDTLAIVVGAAAATAGADGGVTSITNGATVLAASSKNLGSIATPQGYLQSTSLPGRGGTGGDATTGGAATEGTEGEPSATAAGGTGGGPSLGGGTTDAIGGNGTAGGSGQSAEIPLTGGGGGGGGGGARATTGVGIECWGGNGGNGGAPGGGSGGGGASAATVGSGGSGGTPGVPGQGLAFLFWR